MIGKANDLCARWVWGYALPGEFLRIRCSEIASEATFGPKRQYNYHCYLYVFAYMTLIWAILYISHTPP